MNRWQRHLGIFKEDCSAHLGLRNSFALPLPPTNVCGSVVTDRFEMQSATLEQDEEVQKQKEQVAVEQDLDEDCNYSAKEERRGSPV